MPNKESRISCGWLESDAYAANFADLHPPISKAEATAEAQRCYYCYDAPCIKACPTEINIPSFISRIADDNILGAAHQILSANILGGSCARVCPVESLCEGSCVRNKDADRPVSIGLLQRHATDSSPIDSSLFFQRAPSNGKSIAVVGAGPAGLACAHALALLGYNVVIHEAKDKGGGLNEYGIAPYKMTKDFAQQELDFLLKIGGITLLTGSMLGRDVQLADLRAHYKAVFIATGLPESRSLGNEFPPIEGVVDALSFISNLRQSRQYETIKVGREVVVIGGGSTAIDVAMECRRLGSRRVVLAYRRGEKDMSATPVEISQARNDGVEVVPWVRPLRWLEKEGQLRGIVFERTQLDTHGKLVSTGETWELDADMAFTAIGQLQLPKALGDKAAALFSAPSAAQGSVLSSVSSSAQSSEQAACIVTNESFETQFPGVFAGGDCINGGGLTVQAVAHGKKAAQKIHIYLNQGE